MDFIGQLIRRNADLAPALSPRAAGLFEPLSLRGDGLRGESGLPVGSPAIGETAVESGGRAPLDDRMGGEPEGVGRSGSAWPVAMPGAVVGGPAAEFHGQAALRTGDGWLTAAAGSAGSGSDVGAAVSGAFGPAGDSGNEAGRAPGSGRRGSSGAPGTPGGLQPGVAADRHGGPESTGPRSAASRPRPVSDGQGAYRREAGESADGGSRSVLTPAGSADPELLRLVRRLAAFPSDATRGVEENIAPALGIAPDTLRGNEGDSVSRGRSGDRDAHPFRSADTRRSDPGALSQLQPRPAWASGFEAEYRPSAAAPVVHVRIGRVEIRAVSPEAPVPVPVPGRSVRPPGVMTLAEYLGGGLRRGE
jgi:hypothetical protein